MFMPSARVWNEMKSEPAGFWPVPINSGDEYAFLLKAPTHLIKAAYRSCPMLLDVSAAATPVGTVISTMLHIADDPTSPYTVSGALRYAEESLALEKILNASQTLFVLFDELSRPVARAQCTLDREACLIAAALLHNSGPGYVGPWISTLAEVLDELQGLADPALKVPPKYEPTVTPVPITLSDFQTVKIAALGQHEALECRLDDPEEGYVLEQATWHLMEELFRGNIFHSPLTTDQTNSRELTDILGFCNAGICFVEAKAVAVLSTDPHRTTERRAKNIRKQIDKGLDQVSGAVRRLATGLPITSKTGNPIRFPENMGQIRHGIIMVSELLPSIDWEAVGAELLSRARFTGTMLHVLDLRELRVLVGAAQSSPVVFMTHLNHRFQTLAKHKSAYIRTQINGPLPP